MFGPQISTAMVKDSQQIITMKELSSYCTPESWAILSAKNEVNLIFNK
jgi:hypothetical protein